MYLDHQNLNDLFGLRLVPTLRSVVSFTADATRHLWRVVSEEIALLRRGLIVKAHILKLQPHRTITGEIDGALLACAIPVKPARTYVGSIWLADGHEALRLMHQGQLDVICLPRAPGTWRVIEPVQSQIRYDRVGPIPDIPRDF